VGADIDLYSLPDFLMNVLKAFITLFAVLWFSTEGFSTHNRAGEITYEHVDGFTYRIRVTTYTKQSAYADRPSLKIRWGDESSDVEEDELDSLSRSSEILNVANDVKKNEYVGYHSYSGTGTFTISVEDPNRNAGVLNINNGAPGTPEANKTSTSVMAIFAIRTVLVIRPGNNGHNNSIKFLNEPIQDACINQLWIHNPVAYDSLNGDQLVFSLVPCMGLGAQPLDTWESPADYTDSSTDSFVIDPQSGDITWDRPLVAGEYNVAFIVEEFRNGIFVGSVERDMQITVLNCANIPPQISPLPDYCIEANELLQFDVNYIDPNGPIGDVHIQAVGGPLTDVEHVAEYDYIFDTFSWLPRCEEVRQQPYIVSFIATDEGFVPLSDVETVNILVVAPAVQNPVADGVGDQMNLTWDVSPCYDAFPAADLDEVTYQIYRRNNLFGFEPDNCELGVPEYTGYQFIGESNGADNNSFVDDNVNYGGIYCYMVVTVWPDGAISYASEEFCDTIHKEVPVMTKVSISITDITSGIDSVHWSKPGDLDTLVFNGPYKYRLFHTASTGIPDELIYETDEFEFLADGDSTFIHENINTADLTHRYRVQMINSETGNVIATSSNASSMFMELVPGDNEMTINMLYDVPWSNYIFHVYRKAPGEINFTEVGTTTTNTFIDLNLVNNQEYCYKILAIGSYYAEDVPDPLNNWSQEDCSTPYDQTPPCAPVLLMDSDCGEGINTLEWSNPQTEGCDNDITAYQIYYAPVEGQPLQLLATIASSGDTTYIYEDTEIPVSIAGCFAVTALDSLNLWPDGLLHQNESNFSNVMCVDNCPIYFLPNIFSPNGDGLNDLFIPFEYRYVESIDLSIFNRWGNVVFETKDPDIEWNGVNKDSGNESSDGVYYYVIKVNTIRLSGIVTEEFSGTIRIMDGKKPSSSK
jgi:gliding motility-associated-like protein